MRRGGRVLVILGLLLGVITAGGTFLMLSTSQTQPTVPTKQVIVAAQTIPDRTVITVDAIVLRDWPESALPGGAGTYFEKIDDVVGKLSRQPIYPGQIILPPMIIDRKLEATLGTGSNASFVIPEGKIAMAFSLTELTGVGGALQPGDTVDILLTLPASGLPQTPARAGTQTTATTGTEGLPVTQVMLQDILILQVGAWTTGASNQGNAPAGTILTFAIDPQDALALKSAREQGQIDLVLRRAGDHKIVQTEPVNLQYLNKRFNFNLVPLSRQ